MIEISIIIAFISLIIFLSFIDFKSFKKVDLKLNSIIIPVGVIGSFIYIYLSNENPYLAFKNSLLITITSLIAFLILTIIKNSHKKEMPIKNEIDTKSIEEIIEKKLKKLDLINKFDSKLNNIEYKIDNKFNELEEIKTILTFWTKRFDEDTKIFFQESMKLKQENKKQLSLIIKLISLQEKKFLEKIEYFEKSLYKIEHKKLTLDDESINNLLNKIESYINHIKLEIYSFNENLDELFSKETSFINDFVKIEEKIVEIKNELYNIQNQLIHTYEIENLNKELLILIKDLQTIKEEYKNTILLINQKIEELTIKNEEINKNRINKNDLVIQKYKNNL